MEATVLLSRVSPVSGQKIAESEAKNREPLLSKVKRVAPAATLAAKGAAAEGREVEITSLAEEKEAALAFLIRRKIQEKEIKKTILSFSNFGSFFINF